MHLSSPLLPKLGCLRSEFQFTRSTLNNTAVTAALFKVERANSKRRQFQPRGVDNVSQIRERVDVYLLSYRTVTLSFIYLLVYVVFFLPPQLSQQPCSSAKAPSSDGTFILYNF